ncbi:MAG: hypothetical protein Q8941_17545 [Bacteroidota bacterium]|nr:hypothetical protein [Bacteroidota bacterium]
MRKYLLTIASIGLLYCSAQNQTISMQSDFQLFAQGASTGLNSSSLVSFTRKEETVGCQFLFKNWAKGMVTNKQGVSFSNGLFNYDKINKNLYILKGDTTFLVDKYQIQSVMLHDDANTDNYVLEKIPSLKTDDLYIVISKGAKYSLMKSVETKLVLADFHTNGLISSGNKYDEFKDEYKYFVVFPDSASHDVSLKKKSIKSIFDTEKEKVDSFFKEHSGDELNENFLSRLITSLNQ